MKLEKKYTIVIWVLVILVVLNTSAIFTLFYKKQTLDLPVGKKDYKGRTMHHVIDKIGFSKEQKDKALDLREVHYKRNYEIQQKLRSQRHMLLKELAREKPDSLKLDEIAKDIGNLHYGLKKETNHYFMEMRELCTPEQRKEFFMLMDSISEEYDRPFHHGRYHNKGRHHQEGYQYGNKNNGRYEGRRQYKDTNKN